MSKKGAHHGGAWKVAYADFVTAMMALFLVLWLTSQDQKIRDAVERAFNHPFSSPVKMSTGIIPNEQVQAVQSKHGNFDSASKAELDMLRRLNDDLVTALQTNENDQNKTVALELTPDGLRVSVFDRARQAIFEKDTAALTNYGKWVLTTLAWQISRYANFLIEVEGHTEKGRTVNENLDDWELTSNRANVARRVLLQQGVSTGQVRRVVGYADTVPMVNLDPGDEANRRVTIMLKVKTSQSF